VDFRSIIHGLALGVHHLDPVDPYAYRLATGSVVTCDEMEAEIAIPPEPVAPGFAARAAERAASAVAHLRELAPSGSELHGYSTHVSISAPDALVEEVARLLTFTATPALLLAGSAPNASGLMVRPRPGRVELGFSFIPEPSIPALLVLAAGIVLHLARVVAGSVPLGLRRLSFEVVPSAYRDGWYVDGRAAGADLAGGVFETTWDLARDALEGLVDHDDLGYVGTVTAGPGPGRIDAATGEGAANPAPDPPDSAFGSMLQPRRRPGFEIAPVMATWALNLFVVITPSRRRRVFVCIPSSHLPAFLDRLDAGALDQLMRSALRSGAVDSGLAGGASARLPGFFARIGPRGAMLPPEPLLVH
jgi:hypothetical protein